MTRSPPLGAVVARALRVLAARIGRDGHAEELALRASRTESGAERRARLGAQRARTARDGSVRARGARARTSLTVVSLPSMRSFVRSYRMSAERPPSRSAFSIMEGKLSGAPVSSGLMRPDATMSISRESRRASAEKAA